MSQPNGLSFSLLKVSHATDPAKAKKWNWRHETLDVRLMFDNYGSNISYAQTFPILTVLQGNTILERVDLSMKVRDAEDLVIQARRAGKQVKPDDIPTTVLHKRLNCAIAIRYSFSKAKIRRLQLKFESVQDFDRALVILQDLGCHMRGHEGRTQCDLSTSVDWPSSRPTSSALESPNLCLPSASTLKAQDPSQNHSVYSDHFRPTSATLQTFHPTSQLQRSSALAPSPQFGGGHRPSTSLFPIQEDESLYADPVMQNIGGFDAKTQQADVLGRRATAVGSQYDYKDKSGPFAFSDTSTSANTHNLSFLPSRDSSIRPSTTPKITIAQLDNDLSDMIPPRRELPFKRPGSRQSVLSRDDSMGRPSSSADLPTLPKPSFINPPPIESVVPSTKGPAAIGSVKEDTAAKPSDDEAPNKKSAKDYATSVKAPVKAPVKKPSTATTTQNKKTCNTKACGRKASSRPSTALSISSTNAKHSESTLITSDSVPVNSNAEPNSLDADLRNALDRAGSAMMAASPRSLEQESLAKYAELAYEERMTVIERLIVDGISDDNFVTLCEDVYGCWQRIGFGR